MLMLALPDQAQPAEPAVEKESDIRPRQSLDFDGVAHPDFALRIPEVHPNLALMENECG